MPEPIGIPPGDPPARLDQIEARLARIEVYLRLSGSGSVESAGRLSRAVGGEEMEFRVGQDWFARVGIGALVVGVAFTLSWPFRGLPSVVPALAGYSLAALLALVAGRCRAPFLQVAGPLRGGAMALGYFATLRLSHFGGRPPVPPGSAAEAALLTLAVAVNLGLAWRRRSPWLLGLGLLTGEITALAVRPPSVGLALLLGVSIAGVLGAVRHGRPATLLATMALGYAAYCAWALGAPLFDRPVQVASGPPWAPIVLLACLVAGGIGFRHWTSGREPEPLAHAGILLNLFLGYGLFLLHTLAAFDRGFVADQLGAATLLLGLAVRDGRGRRDRVASFVYAMTGFLALSFALIRVSPPPAVFVWLALQSLLVVAAAIALRSRLMIAANFAIFLAIVAAGSILARQDGAIGLGFGLVAMVSARMLDWKRERLELQTGLMRNTYLATALAVFPYALDRLVPVAWVGLAWVGVALAYYLLGAARRERPYRWMGHATLLLTAVYLAVAGIRRLEPLFRNLSFLVLGAVLLAISLLFTRGRARRG
jgi:hypothetical protein